MIADWIAIKLISQNSEGSIEVADEWTELISQN